MSGINEPNKNETFLAETEINFEGTEGEQALYKEITKINNQLNDLHYQLACTRVEENKSSLKEEILPLESQKENLLIQIQKTDK